VYFCNVYYKVFYLIFFNIWQNLGEGFANLSLFIIYIFQTVLYILLNRKNKDHAANYIAIYKKITNFHKMLNDCSVIIIIKELWSVYRSWQFNIKYESLSA